MQPYQQASEALRRSGEEPLRFAGQAGVTALGLSTARLAGPVIGKISSLINEFIPDNMMSKGLEKIDPRFGKFIQGALNEGYSYEDLRTFLGDKVKNSQSTDQKNIIEQESPELHQYLKEEIKKGTPTLRAAGMALFAPKKGQKGFKEIIEKLEKQHKTPWASIVESIYGIEKGNPATMRQEEAKNIQQPPPVNFQQISKSNEEPIPIFLGQTFITRNGDLATITKLDKNTFEYKTENRTRSGPRSSLVYDIQNPQPNSQNNIGSQGNSDQDLLNAMKSFLGR